MDVSAPSPLEREASATAVAGSAPERRRRTRDTRAEILDAAARLIGERGFRSVRVSDIAQELGLSTGIVHYHFAGKGNVLDTALLHAVDRAFERQRQALGELVDARERLLMLIQLQLPRVGEIRDEWSIWLQFWAEAAVRPELRAAQRQLYDRWYETVRVAILRGQADGAFRAEVDADTVAQRLTAMTDGLAIQHVTGSQRISIAAMREILVQFMEEQLLER